MIRPTGPRAFAALSAAAVIAAGSVLVAGGSGDEPGPDPAAHRAASERPAPAYSPAVVRDCWVPAPAGNISLSAEEAKALTTAAARLVDRRRGAQRLRAEVDALLDAEPTAVVAVTATLLGERSTERLTCSYVRLAVEPEEPGQSGLTPRARRLRAAWTGVFGPLIAGGFSPRGVRGGHVDSSAHYEGRAIDVFFRPYDDPEQRRRGRVFAQWLVAHAQDYRVLSVIYADQIWTSWAAWAGWREYVHPSGDTRNPVLRHLDHVHVAVESGRPWRGR